MSELASSLGLAYPFEHKGRKVFIHPRDIDIEGAFSLHVELEQLRAVQRHATHLTQAEYDKALDNWQNSCGDGLYDWGEHGCWRRYFAEPGRKYCLALQIAHCPESRMTLDDALAFVEGVWEDEPASKALLKLVEVANQDPNRKRRSSRPKTGGG